MVSPTQMDHNPAGAVAPIGPPRPESWPKPRLELRQNQAGSNRPDACPANRGRLLYVLTAAFGLEKALGGQLRYLRRAGFEPWVACSPGPELERFAAREGVPGEAVPIEREVSPFRDLVALWRLWRLLRRLRPAITNVSAPKAGLLGGLAAWLAGIPCRVYTLRGLRLETAGGAKYALLWAAEWLACLLAQRVVCVSPGLARRALELRLARPGKLVVAASGSLNGIDPRPFEPGPAMARRVRRLRRRLGIPDDAPVVGFVGRLTRDKGIAELVAAYRRLRQRRPALRLLLVGCFEAGDPVPPEVRQAIESDPGILVTGFVNDPAPYYQLMDVVTLSTYREGYPIVALEAAAARRPFVTTRATGASDAVVEGETGLLVRARDAAALAAAVAGLLDNPRRAAALADRAQRRIFAEFSQRRVWAAWERIYRDLLAQRLVPRAAGRQMAGDFPGEEPGSAGKPPLPSAWALSAGKRVCDVVLAGLGLLAAAPLLLLASGVVARSMGRPILFRQSRSGLAGAPFQIYKFRTLAGGDCWAAGTQPESKAEPEPLTEPERLTAAGRWLRRWSLDELPQLWNVLRGEMSLVGPRPLPSHYQPRYTPRQSRRHRVRPGLTGWAQIRGRNALGWERRFELDLWYVEHAGVWLDLKILARSAALVWSGEGIAPAGAALMPEFLGESRGLG